MRRIAPALAAFVAAALGTAPPCRAAPPPAAVKTLVEAAANRPSVHAPRPVIDAALTKAGVPRDTIRDLWRQVEAAVLPGRGSRLDGFLFQTRDPRWLPLRDRFAEFLTLPGVDRITRKLVARLEGFGGVISFPDLDTLDVASAKRLRGFGGDDWGTAVEFPAVRRLDAGAAAELAACTALVVLPALEELTVETAAALARHEGTGLVIGGLRRLPADVAAALANSESVQGLLLPDLEALDSLPLARRLARQDSIFLPRVAGLAPEVAEALRGSDGGSLTLSGLVDLPVEVARHLADSGAFSITLGGVERLAPDAAAILAKHPGPLVFTGTCPPPVAVAQALDAHAGDLEFQHLRRLPRDVAEALARGDHLLVLPGIVSLDAADAAVLAGTGPLSLPSLTALDVPAAAALAAHAHPLQLEALETLPAAVAGALAAHAGDLSIGGLATLDADAALALAACPGGLVLDSIAWLDRRAAAALLTRAGPLSVGGLTAVERLDSVELARLIARRLEDPVLPLVTALDGPEAAAIAQVLAEESQGELMLPSLERVTTRALGALLRRPGVEIPPSADLRVVADPGGGADDFVDPR